MFALVLGIQEAGEHGWGPAIGRVTVWELLVGGIGLLSLFIFWQSRNTAEPLLPLALFRDRNFTVANVAITTVAFSFTAMGFPLMLYAQTVRDWSPTAAGFLMAPLALASMLLARPVGSLTDRVHPRTLTATGFGVAAISMTLLCLLLTPDAPVWIAVATMSALGVGAACLWGPLSATANRNLPMHQAGAGAGIYNTTRQVGAVLGSAFAALLLDARLRAHDLAATAGEGEAAGMGSGGMPSPAAEAYTAAFRETLWIVPVALCLGLITVLFLEVPKHFAGRPGRPSAAPAASAPASSTH